MGMLRILGASAVALGLLATTGRAADAMKDIPGPIDSLQDLQDTGKMLFKLADDNNDGQISQKEALDVGNLMVGGYFFRADKNGDGALSKEELSQARDQILAERPILRVLVTRVKTNQPQAAANTRGAAQGVMSLLDSNSDGQIQANELRQMVQTSVQSMFAAADTNRDGQLSPSEVNAGMVGVARAGVQAAFQKADSDGNGQISQAEFDKAIVEPANTVFKIFDANNDGQISQAEFQRAETVIANQIRRLQMQEPANSARNLLRSGRTPDQVAPVPAINLNPNNRPGQPVQPGQPVRPVQPR